MLSFMSSQWPPLVHILLEREPLALYKHEEADKWVPMGWMAVTGAGSLRNKLISVSGMCGLSLSYLVASLPFPVLLCSPQFPDQAPFLHSQFMVPHTFTMCFHSHDLNSD